MFKNVYNDFRLRENFICPPLSAENERHTLLASFAHICQLFDFELRKAPKMVHKLCDKIINPTSIEKTKVRLADACFHESAIHALKYYGEHVYLHFQQTAEVLQIVRNWWNIVNVKSRTIARNKGDTHRDEIKNCDSINICSVWLIGLKDGRLAILRMD